MGDTITINVSSGDSLMERATTFAKAAFAGEEHSPRIPLAAYNIAKIMEAYAAADAEKAEKAAASESAKP